MRFIGSEEYAEKHKMTPRAAQMAAKAGAVPARKVSGVWLFEDIKEPPRRLPGRPLTRDSAGRLKAALRVGVEEVPMDHQQRFRVYSSLRRLREAKDMTRLLRSWFRDLEKPALYRIRKSVVDNVMRNQFLSLTGLGFTSRSLLAKYPLQAYVASGADTILSYSDIVIAGTTRRASSGDWTDIWIQRATDGAFEKPVSPSTLAIDIARLSGREVDEAVPALLGPRLDELLATRRRHRGDRST